MVIPAEYKNALPIISNGFPHKNAQKVIQKRENQLAFTIGNSKIGKDTLIFNMGTAHNCPSARLGLCSMAHKSHGGDGSCYALHAEYFYPQSLPFRVIQSVQWKLFSAGEIATAIFAEVSKMKDRKTPIRFVRFNEAGDFYTISCVRKAAKIAEYVAELCNKANIPVVRFYTYTHRKDIFSGVTGKALINSLPKNFTINGSNFKVHNEFRVLKISRAVRDSRDTSGKKVNKYTCLDDCSKCSLCKVHGKDGVTIIQAMH